MKYVIIAAAVSALSLASCTTTYNLSPIQGENMEVVYFQDHEVALSKKGDLTNGVYAYSDGENIILNVAYINESENRINVLPELIEVTAIDEEKGSFQLKVYSGEEYIKKVKREQNTVLALQVISAALGSFNDGYSTTTTYGTYQSNSSFAVDSGSYTSTARTYDPSKAYAAQQARNAEIAQTSQSYRERIISLEQRLIRKTTVFPKQYIQGDVMVEEHKAIYYLINIPFGDETFKYKFKIIEETK